MVINGPFYRVSRNSDGALGVAQMMGDPVGIRSIFVDRQIGSIVGNVAVLMDISSNVVGPQGTSTMSPAAFAANFTILSTYQPTIAIGSITNNNRGFDTWFQPSLSNVAYVNYSMTTKMTLSVLGSVQASCTLQIAPDLSGAADAANIVSIGTLGRKLSAAIAIAVAVADEDTKPISTLVPPTWWVRLLTAKSVTGLNTMPTITLDLQQERLM